MTILNLVLAISEDYGRSPGSRKAQVKFRGRWSMLAGAPDGTSELLNDSGMK